jgi:hypothetical protein
MVQTFRRVTILLEDPESVSILLDERYHIVDVREVHGLRLPEPGVLKYLLTLLPIIRKRLAKTVWRSGVMAIILRWGSKGNRRNDECAECGQSGSAEGWKDAAVSVEAREAADRRRDAETECIGGLGSSRTWCEREPGVQVAEAV